MNSTNKETRKAVVLWLSGIRLEDISALPAVRTLMEHGAMVELDPSPITGPQTQHFQVLSGRLPSRFGFFDTLTPLNRLSSAKQGASGYTVVEQHTGRGAAPKLLPDLLRASGWEVEYKVISPSALVSCVRSCTQSAFSSATCLIVKCLVEARPLEPAVTEAISVALRIAQAWVGETGLLGLLSDFQPAAVECFVNVNNFLAEMGVIEYDEQEDRVNWSNSLAYFMGHGQLWVNLLGRDPQGAVHPQDEYEEVRDTLVKALPVKLRDHKTGAQVIERVYRKEELYSSEYLFCAPDLITVFKPGYVPSPQGTRLNFDTETFIVPTAGETAIAGAHPSVMNGFLLATAPALAAGVSVHEHAPLTATAPTLLHALGVEYADMDAPAVDALFSPSFLETHPVRKDIQSQELSEEDEELVINRLRDLGYI